MPPRNNGDAYGLVQAYRPKFVEHPMSTPFFGDRLWNLAHVFYELNPLPNGFIIIIFFVRFFFLCVFLIYFWVLGDRIFPANTIWGDKLEPAREDMYCTQLYEEVKAADEPPHELRAHRQNRGIKICAWSYYTLLVLVFFDMLPRIYEKRYKNASCESSTISCRPLNVVEWQLWSRFFYIILYYTTDYQ